MENFDFWLSILASAFTVLGVVIPLIFSLVKYVKIAIKEKNWRKLFNLVLRFIAEAEEYTNLSGEGKKQFVMESIEEMADTINYEISYEELSAMIDNIIDITNKVNVDKIKIQ